MFSCSVRLDEESGTVTARVEKRDKIFFEIDLDVEDALELLQSIDANKDYSYTEGTKCFSISPSTKTITFTCKSQTLIFKDEYDECVKMLLSDCEFYYSLSSY